ncbi:MAG: hypothetical protein GY869_17515, partial [Planctomycetes bacterium]|nr:hypothetical protein [Planctomycetota bacterium]
MKQIIIVLFLLVALSGAIESGEFVYQNPWPHEGFINDLAIADDNNFWAVSKYATILRSTNSGLDWEIYQYDPESDVDYYKVTFSDSLHGWIIGDHNQILHTTNGGQDWQFQDSGSEDSSAYIRNIAMVNNQTGWISGREYLAGFYHRFIIHTTDGGANWERQFASSDTSISDIVAIDESKSLALCSTGYPLPVHFILATTNSGLDWQVQTTIDDPWNSFLSNLSFSDSLHGWISGGYEPALVFASENGGVDWQIRTEIWIDWPIWIFEDHLFIDNLTGWLIANGGFDHEVWQTTDGAYNWQSQSTIFEWTVEHLNYHTPAERLFLSGAGCYIAYSDDAALSWTSAMPGIHGRISKVDFCDERHGWIANYSLQVFGRTVNGGQTWQELNSPPDSIACFSLCFVDSIHGFTYGDRYENGERITFLLNTNDGGDSWIVRETDYRNINSVEFANLQVGFIIVRTDTTYPGNRTILRSDDGGETWAQQYEGHIFDIHLLDEQHVWIWGNTGDGLGYAHTTNGGQTWLEPELP